MFYSHLGKIPVLKGSMHIPKEKKLSIRKQLKFLMSGLFATIDLGTFPGGYQCFISQKKGKGKEKGKKGRKRQKKKLNYCLIALLVLQIVPGERKKNLKNSEKNQVGGGTDSYAYPFPLSTSMNEVEWLHNKKLKPAVDINICFYGLSDKG